MSDTTDTTDTTRMHVERIRGTIARVTIYEAPDYSPHACLLGPDWVLMVWRDLRRRHGRVEFIPERPVKETRR